MNRALVFLTVLGAAGCDNGFTLTRPARPDRITAVSGNSDVTLYWDEVPGATGYRVYSGTSLGYDDPLTPGNFDDRGGQTRATGTAVVENVELVNSGTDPLNTTAYIVTAIRGNEESDPSPEVLGFKQPYLISQEPIVSITTTASDAAFGSAIVGVGDVDNDGFEDVVIGSPNASGASGQISLYQGGPGGLSELPSWSSEPSIILPDSARRGTSLAFSKNYYEGAPSILVGAPGIDRVEVYRYGGGATLDVVAVLDGNAGTGFGTAVCAAGNLDGRVPVIDEVAIGAPLTSGGGAVFLYRGVPEFVVKGDPDGPLTPTEIRFSAISLDTSGVPAFGSSLAGGGNLANDASEDLVVGAPGYAADRGAIVVVPGEEPLLQQSMEGAASLVAGTQDGERFGTSLAFLGDVDDDDVAEIAVGAPRFSDLSSSDGTAKGRIVLFLDFPSDATLATADSTFGSTTNALLGSSLTFAGDVQVGAEGALAAEPGVGRVHLYLPSDPQYGPVTLGGNADIPLENLLLVATNGSAVAMAAADVDGDGGSDVILGLPGAKGGQGQVLVYLTIPGVGPRVFAGPPVAAVANVPVRLSAASFSDTQGSRYNCSVNWGDGTPEDVIAPCSPPVLREKAHEFPDECTAGEPALGESCDFAVRITVTAKDGRSGQGLTRVRIPLTGSSP